MIRCKTCLYPTTKPSLEFNEKGECSACVSSKKKQNIDWDGRKKELEQLLDRFNGDVLVPSSGGKDSTYQCIKLKEMGANVTAVTSRTCHLTPIGRRNIDNLAKHVRTMEYVPNMSARAKLNRLGLELVGDISHAEHMAIFSQPFRASVNLKLPLIMYGENPQLEYGGPHGSDEAKQLTRRWRSEYGGFLGLRPSDFVGTEGITKANMSDYELPKQPDMDALGVEAHFLGQYLPWDSHENARAAKEYGMEVNRPCMCNYWEFENLDNAQTGIHDWMAYLKYGYGRFTAQISVDIRSGLVDREYADEARVAFEHIFPRAYADVTIEEMLEHIDYDLPKLYKIMNQFTNWDIFEAPPALEPSPAVTILREA